MIFAQNRQNWVLSTKSVNKSVFDNKKGAEKPPSDCRTAFPKGEHMSLRRMRYEKIYFLF